MDREGKQPIAEDGLHRIRFGSRNGHINPRFSITREQGGVASDDVGTARRKLRTTGYMGQSKMLNT